MALRVKRKTFDFLAENYKKKDPRLTILEEGFDRSRILAQPTNTENFIERWYLSLQGEDSPIVSTAVLSQEKKEPQPIYRYDWAFGVTVIKGFWWNWLSDLCEDGALAMHLLMELRGDAPEAIPVSATLSALHPSRNTKGFWEFALPIFPQVAADAASLGSHVFHPLEYAAIGLTGASNLINSYAENGKNKNWFLYQFFDEEEKCPTVEWRINRKVFMEYGPLIRGTLFVAFHGTPELHSGAIRFSLRPQIRYYEADPLLFITPTKILKKEEQVFLDVKPQEAKL